MCDFTKYAARLHTTVLILSIQIYPEFEIGLLLIYHEIFPIHPILIYQEIVLMFPKKKRINYDNFMINQENSNFKFRINLDTRN